MNPAEQAVSPHVDLDRAAWARLRGSTPLSLTESDLERLGGIGDPVDLAEVTEIYLPLSRLLNMHVAATRQLHAATARFLGVIPPRTPFLIGIAGSVAVGKSTTARILREVLARSSERPEVALVTTDGFLWRLAELQRRGILERKGFPDSYDQRALLRFVISVKSGIDEVHAPVYSHLTYDIVPGEWQTVTRPDILIIEGLNVLQTRARVAISDFFDFSIYVDAAIEDLRRWYVERFLALRESAFADPHSYFHRFATLGDADAVSTAEHIWHEINEPNLVENIEPTRGRATLVLHKDGAHAVDRIHLRRL